MSIIEGGSFLEEDSKFAGSVDITAAQSYRSFGMKGSQSLSCAHVNSPERQYLTGYTGQRFKIEGSVTSSPIKIPAIGYTGTHIGKVHGKIGRIELHKKSISEEEPEEEDLAVARKSYHIRSRPRDPTFNENSYVLLKYETSSGQAIARGQSITRILDGIATKLELKHAGRMQRHLAVRNMFALYDPTGTELCSIDDFYSALLNLGVMLPNVEFESLCNEFDEHRSGEISWAKFMNSVGANSTKGGLHKAQALK